MKHLIIIFLIIYTVSIPSSLFSQISDFKGNNKVCVSKEELKLYNLINDYRKSKGLSKIELSRSLTFVAQTHVRDLENNKPAKGWCNMHSWSDKGTWTACCYTSDHEKAKCMWDKPRELTSYKANGFEISYGASGSKITAIGALDGWKSSIGHNNVIVNKSIWKDMDWEAIGIGIYGGYAVVWFGVPKDSEKIPVECD